MANYCSSDWHGAEWAWPAVKGFLKSDDTLYYLGDATGRCNNIDGGWHNFKEVLDDSRLICLCGNHEDMLLRYIFQGNGYLCYINGEMNTIEAIQEDRWANTYGSKIKKLPLAFKYTRPDGKIVYMSHSGSTNTQRTRDLIWDRMHYLNSDKPDGYDYVIMGHTNVRYINNQIEELNEFYANEEPISAIPEPEQGACWIYPWLIDVDCLTIKNKHITLLDLDTFKQYIISPFGINKLS